MAELLMIRGGLYRNRLQACLWAVSPLDAFTAEAVLNAMHPEFAVSEADNPFRAAPRILGQIWVMESRDLFGRRLNLATTEWLTSFGYELVSQVEEVLEIRNEGEQ